MPETELAVLTPRGPRRRSSETPDSWEAIPLPSPSGTFTFADACFGAGEPYANYTSIRGVTRPGLIVDPGAARGLIGSDTLRVLINVVIKPAGMAKHIRWTSSTNLFTGISAATEKSLGIVSIPIGLAGIAWSTFKADVLGGSASCCPGLIPLSSLLSQGCVISCGHFSNGDGLLGIRSRTGFCAQRLLLTDSGHYLLPVDQFNMAGNFKTDKEMIKTAQLLSKSVSQPATLPKAVFVSGMASSSPAEDAPVLEHFQ